MTSDNVVFVSEVSGPNGKGVASKHLGLSHFVDNKWEVLQSVFADKAGNSGDLVQRFQGFLFHFANGGTGRWKPKRPFGMSTDLQAHYCAVSGWSEVLGWLRDCVTSDSSHVGREFASERNLLGSDELAGKQDHTHLKATHAVTTAGASTSMLVHRISVGIEEDDVFRVVNRLLGAKGENFDYIASTSASKVILNGRGSPHPQPRSFDKETLTVCIRAKTNEHLQEAIVLVEDLLKDIRQEYQDFQES